MKYRITHLREGRLYYMCYPRYTNDCFKTEHIYLSDDQNAIRYVLSYRTARKMLAINQEIYTDSKAIIIEVI